MIEHLLRVLFLLFCAILASYITTPAVNSDWYGKELLLPKWVPSRSFFPVIWTFIYLTYIYVWITMSKEASKKYSNFDAWTLDVSFIVSMMLNALWCYTFFGIKTQESIRFSIVVIVMLLLVVLYQLKLCYSQGKHIQCGFLCVYIAWLAVATSLNFSVQLS